MAKQTKTDRLSVKKTKSMDKLSLDAMLARKAGMSYGKWKAMHPDKEPLNCKMCGTEETGK